MDGTYGFTYCGFEGIGMGIFRVAGSELVGVDIAGGRYQGIVAVDKTTGEIDLSFNMSVPAGVFLVQGTSPMDVPYLKSARVKTPPAFGDGKPFEVYVAPGTITLMVKRISDEYAPFADGISVNIQPLREI
jgi:hypothetical protein